MTVIPIHGRSTRRGRRGANGTTASTVSGTFTDPNGCAGTFEGSYRLERLVSDHGQTAAAGVFAGDLLDADHRVIGTGSRRHTAAVVIEPGAAGHVASLGPVEVNLIGFPVLVHPFSIALTRDLPAAPLGSSSRSRRHVTDRGLQTTVELFETAASTVRGRTSAEPDGASGAPLTGDVTDR